MNDTILIGLCFFVIAVFYSTVGHAGASGYLAAMALLGFSADVMKPTALALNILVASVASWRFYSAGLFSWRSFWPFAAASVPFAYLGGGLSVDAHVYKQLVGAALVFSAAHLLIRLRMPEGRGPDVRPPGLPASMAVGGLIGFMSGLTGVGGGIFLSPVLVVAGWAGLRQTSALAAVFILVNSAAGLAGHLQKGGAFAGDLAPWGAMVLAGGFIGASLGATRLNSPALRAALGMVLVFAGLKMVAV